MNVKSLLSEYSSTTNLESTLLSSAFSEYLEQAQSELHSSLIDSFDTPRAMRIISDLIKEANIHISSKKQSPDVFALEAAARWITKIVGIFGLDANASLPYDGIGWKSKTLDTSLNPKEAIKCFIDVYQRVKAEVENLSLDSEIISSLLCEDIYSSFDALEKEGVREPEALSMPFLRAVSRIRDELRKMAPTSPVKKQILALSDEIRDQYLFDLGVYLDDRSLEQGALIKFVPKEELLLQREEKAAKELERLALKEKLRLEREKAEAEKAEKAKISPTDMFRNDERWSAWDNDGIPTKTKEGTDVPKSALKKLRKDWERQKKVHADWKAKSIT